MINHYGEGFVNTVHAYNRVLNDVFEDDAINLHNVAEASIDVEVSAQRDTFVIFQAGQFACDGTISFELMVNGDRYSAEKQISVPRFCCQQFFLSEIFALNEIKGGVLRVRQPQQNLFFGRILAGQKDLKSSAFSANHSYYDSSKVEEYWGESAASQRCYPFFPDLENRIRMYPIQSPSRIAMSLVAFDSYGEQIVRLNLGNISSPSSEFLDCNVTAALEERSVDIDSVSAFEVIAVADEGRVPTRINHQLIYGQKDALCASINVSLANPGEFSARGRQKMCWGQMVVSEEIASDLGIVMNTSNETATHIEMSFYDGGGLLNTFKRKLDKGRALRFSTLKDSREMFGGDRTLVGSTVWYTVRVQESDISAFVVSRSIKTGHCTGEHSY